MKKLTALLILLALILTACSNSSEEQKNQTPIQMDNYVHEPEQALNVNEIEGENGVDIDITQMTETMVYSQVFDMVMNAQDYQGKVIKMKGLYNPLYFEPTDTTYHLMVITDATGCCPQGVEFVITSEGQQYPEINTEIQVTGVFEIYQEGEQYYFRIVSDELVVLN